MKEIQCVENNGYNITVGNKYLLLQESQDFYYIVNDNERTVKYNKQMFKLAEEEAIPEVVVPAKRTEQDMIDSINYIDGRIRFNGLDNELITVNRGFDSDSISAVSCGIKEVEGIDTMIANIDEKIPEDDDYVELRKAIFKKIIQERVIRNSGGENCGMRILSTTTSQDSDMLSVLDELADVKTEAVNNPNNGNYIKMWCFYTN